MLEMTKIALAAVSIGFVSFSFVARAESTDSSNFETRKAEILKEIDERVQKMQEHRTCVSGATSPEMMRQCRAAMKEFHKGEKAEHKEKRKERIEKRMQKLEEQKQKLESESKQ